MNNLKIIKTTINIGLEKPVKLLHITDTHICRDDPTGWNRQNVFDVDYAGCNEDYFFKALDYAKENDMPVLHTGDLIDFFSDGNFEFIDKYFKDVDYIYAAGNHDFCHFLGKAEEDHIYKWEKIKEIAPHFKNNLYFDSRTIGGVNIVTLDNSYYRMTDGQIDLLKAEAAKGLPIILCMHIPLYTKSITSGVSYVMGATKELLDTYPEYRRLEQTPDEVTLRAIDYIKSEPLIKAIIAGHRHLNHEETLENGIMQYVTHGSFAGYVREITII